MGGLLKDKEHPFIIWANKARVLGIYDDYVINRNPKYNITAIVAPGDKPKYYYELKAYTGKSKNIVLPPVDRICIGALENNKYAETIVVDNKTMFIEPYAFSECYNLRKLDLSKCKIEVLANRIVYNCKHLEEIIIGNKLDSVGTMALADCKNLKEIKLNNIELIYDKAFKDSGLETLILKADKNLLIDEKALENCNKLKKLTIDVKDSLTINGTLLSKEFKNIEEIWVRPQHCSIIQNHCDIELHKFIKIL